MSKKKPSPTGPSPAGPSQADQLRAAAEEPQGGLVQEFWSFLRYSKKWWLTPIVVVLLLITALVILAGTGAAPFLYTLF